MSLMTRRTWPPVTSPLASDAAETAWSHLSGCPGAASVNSAYIAQTDLARGDLAAARRWADDGVTSDKGVVSGRWR